MSNGKYGFVNRYGDEVIPLIYDEAEDFDNGEAQVSINGEWFYIDKNGNEVSVPADVEYIDPDAPK